MRCNSASLIVPALGLILLAALALRLLLLPIAGYRNDILSFTSWANALGSSPWDRFYTAVRPGCDYLPGYLYLLVASARMEMLLSGEMSLSVQAFEPWIKAGAVLADLVLALAVYGLVRRFAGPGRALLAAALAALNPASMFVGAVWGQVDSVAVALSMLALLALVSGRPAPSAVLASAGFLVKPQYSLFLAVAGVAYLRHETALLPCIRSRSAGSVWVRWAAGRIGLPIAALLTTAQAMLLPFSVSIWRSPGVTWSLQDRISMASSRYPSASWGAYNLWDTSIARAAGRPDGTLGWLSISYQHWGCLLLGGVVVACCLLAWKRAHDPQAMLWACFVVAFAFFEVMTRMHERYLFPAIPVIAGITASRLSVLPIYLGMTGFYLLNLWGVWAARQQPAWSTSLMGGPDLHRWVANLGLLLFLGCLAILALILCGGSTQRLRPHPSNVLTAF